MKEKKAKIILERVKDTYDLIADEFANTRQNPVKEFPIYDKYIKKTDFIVDLGCGNGRLLLSIPRKTTYIGIDNNNKLLELAKKKHPQNEFINGNQLKIPVKDKTADVLINIRSFHHIPSKKLRETALSEMKRVLKKDGILIISVWDLWQPKYAKELILAVLRSLITLGSYDYNDAFIKWGKKVKRYYHAFRYKELYNLIGRAGFTVLESHKKFHDFIIIAKNV